MKKLPKSLFAVIFALVFSFVILPEIKDNLSTKSYAAENSTDYTILTTESETTEYPTPAPTTCKSTDTVVSTTTPTGIMSGVCGDNLTWTLDFETGELVVKGSGSVLETPWHSYREFVKSAKFDDGITDIGSFYEYINLESLIIPNGVTTIHDGQFAYCYKLETIVIPNSVTDIYHAPFRDCISLKSVTLPDSLKWLYGSGDIFGGCENLTNIIVSPDNPSFSNDENGVLFNKDKTELVLFPPGIEITNYVVPDSVENIGYQSFYTCNSLKTITLGDNIKTIDYNAFCCCDNLENIIIGREVRSIDSLFISDCNNLKNITVNPDNSSYSSDEYGVLFNKDKTELIRYPSGNARTSYEIPDIVTIIGDLAFYDCGSLESIIISDSVENIGHMSFYACDSLSSITIPESVTSIGSDSFHSCTNLKTITIPDSVTSIDDYAFSYCSSLKYIHLPTSVTEIGENLLWGTSAYICSKTEDCYAKTYADKNGIEFKVCEGIHPEIITGECGDNLTWEFDESTGTLTISGTGDMWDSPSWSSYKSSVKSVILPDGLTSIGDFAFFSFSDITSIKFPDSLTRIGDSAFEYCHGLTEVTIGDGVTDIGYKAFVYCNGLARVTIPASVERCDISAFDGSPNLKFISVDKNNKNYLNDSRGVLYTKDMSVLIRYPSGNTATEYAISIKTEQICTYAFSRADNLTDVYYEGSQKQWNQIYHPEHDELKNATIHFGTAEPEETTTVKSTESQPVSTTLNHPTSTTTHPHTFSPYPTTMPATTAPSTNPNNISEIYIEDMVLIADIDGCTDSVYYEDEINGGYSYEYFRYYISPQKITVVFDDGTTFTGNQTEIFIITGHWLQINDNQSYKNQWGVGNHYVSASLGNARTTYKVEIIETPVESVKLDFGKPYFTENVDGYLLCKFDENGEVSDSFFFYEINDYTAEITFKKGFEHYQDISHGYSISCDQSFDNPWGVGKHAVTFSCLGYEEDIEIEVVANTNEIKKISVEKAGKLYRELDSYLTSDSWCDDSDNYCILTPEYEFYSVEKSNPVITVEYEDGTVISEDMETMRDIFSRKNPLFYYYFTVTVNSTQSYENQWGIGKHTAYLIFFDKIVPFEIEVAENPVSSIEFVKAPDKTVYIKSECSDIRGAVVRVNYKDGEYKDVPLNRDSNFWETYYYDEKLGRVENLFISQYVTECNQIEVFFDNEIKCFYPITVKENLIEGISIRNSENNDLIITVYNSDGTTEDMKMLYYWGDDGGDCETEMHRGGFILTDKGIFSAYFYYYFSGYHTVQLDFWDGTETKVFESNKLADCPWLDLWYKLPLYLYDEFTFSGEITEDNVDTIALLSIIYDEDYVKHPLYPYDDDSWRLKSEYDADYIAGLINKNFVADNIDLSVSERYNPSDNTISINTDLISEALHMQYTVPIVFKDGYWYVGMRGKTNRNALEYDKFCYLIYDDDLRIVAFSTEEMPVIEKPNITIKQPTETVISYGDSIILHADISKLPAGGYIEWSASNSNFETKVSADGTTCKITPKTSGDTTFTATLCDADGNAVLSDEQVMTAKAGFFQKIAAFFRKIFGLTKIIPQIFKK